MASPATWFRNVLLRMRFNRRHALHPGFLKVSARDVELSRYRIGEGAIQIALIWTFRWEEVVRILAFKRDVFAFGLICVAFDLADGTAVETDEQMIGFTGLVDALPGRFADMDLDWRSKVAQPPFETRPTPVWSRPGRGVPLGPADEWSQRTRACLGSVVEDIPRPKQERLSSIRNPFDR